ncbi:MAG: ChaB family protein [bacterium]
MPYPTVLDLPETLQQALPPHAQEIYRAAFNHAWQEYADRMEREKLAHQVAWSAVKRFYIKNPEGWVNKTLEE